MSVNQQSLNPQLNIASFFAGAGGMDVGFTLAGFKIIWANEFDKGIYPTYQANHPTTILDTGQ